MSIRFEPQCALKRQRAAEVARDSGRYSGVADQPCGVNAGDMVWKMAVAPGLLSQGV